jgi:hypothetical protein
MGWPAGRCLGKSKRFRRDRLLLIAEYVIAAAADARADLRPDKGDDSWVLGVVRHARVCRALIDLALAGKHPWLTAQQDNHKLTLKLGGCPLYYYRGDPQHPTQDRLERAQQQLNFSFRAASDLVWMLILETTPDGNPRRVVVQRVTPECEPKDSWTAVEVEVPPVNDVTSIAKEGPDTPKPTVFPKKKKAREDEDGEDR